MSLEVSVSLSGMSQTSCEVDGIAYGISLGLVTPPMEVLAGD